MVSALLPGALLISSLRFYAQHPWQAVLALCSVALGAAVVVAVGLANHSALVAFDRAVTELSPRATHRIVSPRGQIDDNLLALAEREWRLPDVWPELRLDGALAPADGEPTRLSLHAGMPLRQSLPGAADNRQLLSAEVLADWLAGDAVVALSQAVAREHNLGIGDEFDFLSDGAVHRLRVVALFDAFGLKRVAIADVSLVQRLAGRVGQLDALTLTLSESEATALAQRLPAGLSVQQLAGLRAQFAGMTKAFRISVHAMSLLTVLVGAFLVYNTLVFMVLRRRSTLGAARLVGASRVQLFNLLVLEAFVLGVLGAAIGMASGVLLARAMLSLLDRVFVDIYGGASAPALLLSPEQFAIALSTTLASVALASLGPARQAAETDPVALINQRQTTETSASRLKVVALAGLVLIAVGGAILIIGADIVSAYLGLFVIVIGYGCIVPAAIRAMLTALAPLVSRCPVQYRLAQTALRQSLSRTALAVAALAVALAASIGIGSMVGAFRTSVDAWLAEMLNSEIYLTPRIEEDALPISEADIRRLADLPGVASVSSSRRERGTVDGFATDIVQLDPGAQSVRGFSLTAGRRDAQYEALVAGRGVLASEPLARRLGVRLGDKLVIVWSHGQVEATLLGLYRDYSSSQGVLAMGDSLARRAGDSRPYYSAGVALNDVGEMDSVRPLVQAVADALRTPYDTVDSAAIRVESLAVFDRTFAITDVIKLLVMLVAVLGVFSALSAVLMERRAEFAALRALGLTPRQLRVLLFSLSAALGLLAAVFAVPLGALLAWLLIDVINTRAFGWSIDLRLDLSEFTQVLVLGPLAALAAALVPASRYRTAAVQAVTRL